MDNPTPKLGTDEDDAQVLQWFREFLAIPTCEPKPDYHAAVALLQKIAQSANFECEVFHYDPARPILLVTWLGTEPSLPCLLLNSHTDVVPAVREFWHSDPFTPLVRDNGDIVARGTQDMKCVCIQYLESLRRLRRSGFKPRRTIKCTFVPDEEIGGVSGMKCLSQDSARLKTLNIGLVLDEGLASQNNKFKFFYGERVPWWIKVTAKGPTGHGSQFIPNTAVSKLNKVISALLEYREAQKEELAKGAACGITLGDVTTVNVSYLKAGITNDSGKSFTMNVVPNEAEAGFDIRIAPQVDIEQFRKKLNDICSEEGVTWNFVPGAKDFKARVSALTPENPWWVECERFFRSASVEISTEIFPAGTDAAFLRNIGYIAFGFSPINNTPLLLHDHNEFLNGKTFCRGVEIYNGLLAALASLPAQAGEKHSI